MAITNERAEILAKYLSEDAERAEVLIELEAECAAEKLREAGYDFSVEEIVSFGEELKKAAGLQTDGEIGEDDLENVAGGSIIRLFPLFPGTTSGWVARKPIIW